MGHLDELRQHRRRHGVHEVRRAGQVRRESPATRTTSRRPTRRAQVKGYEEGGENRIFLDYAKKFAVLRPVTPGYPFIATEFTKTAQDILNGADPKQALDKAVKNIDANQKSNGYFSELLSRVSRVRPEGPGGSPTTRRTAYPCSRLKRPTPRNGRQCRPSPPAESRRSSCHDAAQARGLASTTSPADAARRGPADHVPAHPDRSHLRAGLHQRPADLTAAPRSSSASTTSCGSSTTTPSGRRCATRSSSPSSIVPVQSACRPGARAARQRQDARRRTSSAPSTSCPSSPRWSSCRCCGCSSTSRTG